MCIITANPDIAGIGVRVAIYLRAFFSVLPSFVYGILDYLEEIEQDVNFTHDGFALYTTGCALLLSAFFQAASAQGLTIFHALIVLNLSWLKNLAAVAPTLTTCTHAIGQALLRHSHPYHSAQAKLSKRERYRIVALAVMAVVHFSIMAAFGIWVFSSVATFDPSYPNCTESTVYFLFGHNIPVTNAHFQKFSRAIYWISVVPIIGTFTIYYELVFLPLLVALPVIWIIARIFEHFYPPPPPHMITARRLTAIVKLPYVSLLLLYLIVFILSTEGTIARNSIALDEHRWTFGQTLALVVVLLPAYQSIRSIRKISIQYCRLKRRAGVIQPHVSFVPYFWV